MKIQFRVKIHTLQDHEFRTNGISSLNLVGKERTPDQSYGYTLPPSFFISLTQDDLPHTRGICFLYAAEACDSVRSVIVCLNPSYCEPTEERKGGTMYKSCHLRKVTKRRGPSADPSGTPDGELYETDCASSK